MSDRILYDIPLHFEWRQSARHHTNNNPMDGITDIFNLIVQEVTHPLSPCNHADRPPHTHLIDRHRRWLRRTHPQSLLSHHMRPKERQFRLTNIRRNGTPDLVPIVERNLKVADYVKSIMRLPTTLRDIPV